MLHHRKDYGFILAIYSFMDLWDYWNLTCKEDGFEIFSVKREVFIAILYDR